MRNRSTTKRRLLAATLGGMLACGTPPASAQAEPDASRIGRSSGAKAPEFQELYDYDAAAKTLADATFPYEVQVHRAHVVMLAERAIVTRAEAAAILRGLAVAESRALSAG